VKVVIRAKNATNNLDFSILIYFRKLNKWNLLNG
jgi:hypothetical protein